MTGQQFYEGAMVTDTAGEKVGALHAYDPEGGYITVQKGFLFHKDLYIPLSDVQSTDADGTVRLSRYKDDLADARYDSPPATASGLASEDNYAQTTTVAETTTRRASAVQAPAPTPAPRQAQPTRAAARTTTNGTIAVPVFEEQLVVGTQQEETGRVHLHKEVTQEQVSIPVTLRREEITVERVATTGQMSAADLANVFQDQVIEVPVMGEEAVVGKQAHVVEEVRLHKDDIQEQQQVTGAVRKERVVVDGVKGQQRQTQGRQPKPRRQ
jgi:uncharacterized protein (TIGR02271 family)